MDPSRHRVSVESLESYCAQALRQAGLPDDSARTTAKVLATIDTWGIFSHGTKQLRNYLLKVRAGGINPGATPTVVTEGRSWAMMDGNRAMAMVSSTMAMDLAIRKAKDNAFGYVGVKNSTHFGAAGYYATMAVEYDMIGIAMSNVDTNMTVPGARGSVIGNNPFAYAVPAGKELPIFLDIAMSTVAAGKIYSAQASGKPIPDTWLVDAEGLPTTDISHYPHVGSLLPMAGHKGYGLAVLIEVLAAVLTGAGITSEVKSWMLDLGLPTDEGHAFFAIDVGVLMPVDQFKERVDRMIRSIRTAPTAKGSDRIYLPGELEWERRKIALAVGLELPDDVWTNLATIGQEAGIDPAELAYHSQ